MGSLPDDFRVFFLSKKESDYCFDYVAYDIVCSDIQEIWERKPHVISRQNPDYFAVNFVF